MRYRHVCPRNCYSACSIISHVENDKIVLVTGDPHHPYTKGKLCAKGHAHVERMSHPQRLKRPYYRQNKAKDFSPISWKKAYELIVSNLVSLYKEFGHFYSFGLYKHSGNLGILQNVTDDFFSSLGGTTKIMGNPGISTGVEALHYQAGKMKMSDPNEISNSDLIIIWGGNPAVTNIHLIPIIREAIDRGASLVVIDPIYTKTAELADLYIQLRPSTDGFLANQLVLDLVQQDACDYCFLNEYSEGFEQFLEEISLQNRQDLLKICGISKQAFMHLSSLLRSAKAVSHVIGPGLQRHANGGQNVRAIEALAAVRGDLGTKGGGLYFRHEDGMIFNNQQLNDMKDRNLNMNKWIKNPIQEEGEIPIQMLWITCRNPLTQDPYPQNIRKHLLRIPFVVTVEEFMTPTAKASNLVLPTTSIFEQEDIVTSIWHKEIAYNEKALNPYFESKSEWEIITTIAQSLKSFLPNYCSFPLYKSEKAYLESQFNKNIYESYNINTPGELRSIGIASRKTKKIAWEDRQFYTKTGKYKFYSSKAKGNGLPPTPVFVKGRVPTKMFPFWLITPHHPYTLNSQFHFHSLLDDKEPCVKIAQAVAKRLGIHDGEMIRVFNAQGSLVMKSICCTHIPEDILEINSGHEYTNQLIPIVETDMGEQIGGANGVAYFDTFVNITKL